MSVWLVAVETTFPDGSCDEDVAVVVAATELGARRRATKSIGALHLFEYRAVYAERVDDRPPGVVLTGRSRGISVRQRPPA